MGTYKKRPVEIEAQVWEKLGDLDDIVSPYSGQFKNDTHCMNCRGELEVHGWVETLEGGHIVCPGDFIITGVQGEIYPCKPDIFAKTYERVG